MMDRQRIMEMDLNEKPDLLRRRFCNLFRTYRPQFICNNRKNNKPSLYIILIAKVEGSGGWKPKFYAEKSENL
jgi:hypothetical protein